MRQLTQSRPENCLQTCIAILLDVDPESMPQQHELERLDDRSAWGKALRAYLDKHHGLTYVEVPPRDFEKQPRWATAQHVIIGECSRTTSENYVWHAIVGAHGAPVWDVSPTRAGLTRVTGWGLLVPTPAEWKKEISATDCVCAACAKTESEAA